MQYFVVSGMKKFLSTLVIIFLSFEGMSQNIDINLLKEINVNRNKNLDGTFLFFTHSDIPVCIGSPLITAGIGLLKKDSALTRKGLYMSATFVVASGISVVMKYGINRDRPFVNYPFIEKMTDGGSPSFPSGHTSSAFAAATSLSLAFPKWYVIAPSFIWASGVGYSRMHLGVHYPSDVLAGAIIGAGSAYVCHKINLWLVNRK